MFLDVIIASIDWKQVFDTLKSIVSGIRSRVRLASFVLSISALATKLVKLQYFHRFHVPYEIPSLHPIVWVSLGATLAVLAISLVWGVLRLFRPCPRSDSQLDAIVMKVLSALSDQEDEWRHRIEALEERLDLQTFPLDAAEVEEPPPKQPRLEQAASNEVETSTNTIPPPPNSPPPVREGPARPCWRCLNPQSHLDLPCPYLKKVCNNCLRVGHASWACPNFVVKDPDGRVATRVEPKPGSTTVTHRKDRSQGDKLVTADQIMQGLRNLAATRASKAKVYRERRKEELKAKEAADKAAADAAASAAANGSPAAPQTASEKPDVEMQVQEVITAVLHAFGYEVTPEPTI